MTRLSKSLLSVVIVLIGLVVAYSYYDRQFRLANIQGKWPTGYAAQIAPAQIANLQEAVAQPFHYLDRGKQSFVFISQDQKTVLKFFDARCMRSGVMPFLFSVGKKQCSKRLRQLFEGYKVAHEHDGAHAGLLFLQLAPDPSYHVQVSVIDRFGIKHEIDLSEVPFVLQE
jgi:hypothetical protein